MPTLVDTNVFVYALGIGTAEDVATRQPVAIRELSRVRATGAVSVQVLAELGSVLVRRGVHTSDARRSIAAIADSWRVLSYGATTIVAALDAVEQHHLGFWDALLWATAKQEGATEILSEDGLSMEPNLVP